MRISALILLLVSLAGAADRQLLPPCCLASAGFSLPFTSPLGHSATFPQRQEHAPGTCNNLASNKDPCKCHGATECLPPGERPTDPATDDSHCTQYCDEGDCLCHSSCTT